MFISLFYALWTHFKLKYEMNNTVPGVSANLAFLHRLRCMFRKIQICRKIDHCSKCLTGNIIHVRFLENPLGLSMFSVEKLFLLGITFFIWDINLKM